MCVCASRTRWIKQTREGLPASGVVKDRNTWKLHELHCLPVNAWKSSSSNYIAEFKLAGDFLESRLRSSVMAISWGCGPPNDWGPSTSSLLVSKYECNDDRDQADKRNHGQNDDCYPFLLCEAAITILLARNAGVCTPDNKTTKKTKTTSGKSYWPAHATRKHVRLWKIR